MLHPLGCRDCPGFDLFAASIRKSGPEIGNRSTKVPGMYPIAAAIVNSGPEIKNHCSTIVAASRIARLLKPVVAVLNGPPAAFVAALMNCPPAAVVAALMNCPPAE
ncbi:MAG: hypothetical protein SOV31_02235 [Candidatus Cryptobacteroides sp.]|nr:hypothetical protein [Candidatus Cryptobacteroides sp.]